MSVSDLDDDDSAIKLARRYRREAIAALVCVIRNDDAPSTARAIAAEKLLNISDGKPVSAKPVGINDVENMTDTERELLFEALLTYYARPGVRQPACMEDDFLDDEQIYAKPPSFPAPLSVRTRTRPRLNDDDEKPPLRRRTRPRLLDDDDEVTEKLEPLPEPPPLKPVPGPGQYLIELPHPITVNFKFGRSVALRAGYNVVTEEIATHPIISKYAIIHEADHAAA